MAEFKPMVKMMTTEPSVELKLKKGGSASHDRMMREGGKMGHKPVKKQTGGAMAALNRTPTPATAMSNMPVVRAVDQRRTAPAQPRATAGGVSPIVSRSRATPAPAMASGLGAAGAARPLMRKSGGETKAEHMAEMKKMKGTEKKLEKHASLPASKAHKGLKTGGIAKSPKPAQYATGGVVNGQGGFKKGGSVPASGIIKTMTKKTTKMDTAHVDHNSAPTGEVKLGNAGGYKKGGKAVKKHFATGGVVDSGRPVAMPKKPASRPVHITELSGTFKTGGKVKKAMGGAC